MKVTIIQIGNSQGIRIPKPILKQCKLQNEVELEIHKNELVIRSLGAPRKGWSKKFATMAAKGDDALLDSYVQSKWDKEEWEWK
jgi:antitoxin MazE